MIGKGDGLVDDNVPYDLVGYITEIDTGLIDSDYMNSRFDKYIKLLRTEGTSPDDIERAMNELHRTFATLTQEEQKYADIFLHDIQRGDVEIVPGKTLRDYINEYGFNMRRQQVRNLSRCLGLDETMLVDLMNLDLNENNLNVFGYYEDLKKTIDKELATKYFEAIEGKTVILPKVFIKADELLREFILSGGIDIEIPEELNKIISEAKI